MSTPEHQPATAEQKPPTVILLQCAKSRCGHVLTEDEYVWKSDRSFGLADSKTAHCPRCDGVAFYTLNALGQIRKSRDESPREIDPTTIEPSPRMGLKMKRRILAAKRRAIESIAAQNATPTL